MNQHEISLSVSGRDVDGTLVAFHGVTDNAASLSDVALHWKDRWKVLLVDTLGHGLSRPFTHAELEDPFSACVCTMSKVVIEAARDSLSGKVVLMGHSLGGAVAAHIADRYPECVSCVVLEDPALLTPEQQDLYRNEAAALVARQELVTEHVGEAIVELMRVYGNWPPSEYGPWAQGKTQVDRDFVATGVVGALGRDVLCRLRMPTLLLTGDKDDVLFGGSGIDEIAKYANRNLSSALISNATHTVRRDQPETFYSLVDAFLKEHHRANNPIHPFIASELKPVLEGTPAQITATQEDVLAMRAEGERLLSGEDVGRGSHVENVALPSGRCVVRVIRRETSQRGECSWEGSAKKSVVISIHGGGYVAGKAIYDDCRNSELMELFGATAVVSPEYHLAPEDPWPSGRDDCLDTVRWVKEVFPGHDVFLYGDSAGAGLAVETVEGSDGLAGLVLLEPCLEPQMATRSFDLFADGPVWTRAASTGAWKHYLRESPDKLAVLGREELANFPPTLIFVNPVDPLRDEGIGLATRLVEAGVPTSLHMFPGTFHGALSVPGTNTWDQVQSVIAGFLSTSF